MLGQVSVFSDDKHTLIRGEMHDWLQRLIHDTSAGKRALFVVRYNEIGSFVIAEWMSNNHDVFVDVMNLGMSLANFNHGKAQELRKRLFAPITQSETLQHSAEADSDFHHELQDFNEELKDIDAERGIAL